MEGLFKAAVLALLFPLAACVADIPAAKLEQRYTTPASTFITASDGTRIHMRDEGPRDAPVLLLLHGSNSSLQSWEPWVADLTRDHRVVSFDFPGHGLTGPAKSGVYTAPSYLAVIEDVRKAAGIERAVVAGNSMGGYMAWRYALAHPERVSGLVLISAAGYPLAEGRPAVFALAAAPVLGEMFSSMTNPSMIERNLKTVMADDADVTPALVQRYTDLLLHDGNREATLKRLRTPIDQPDAWKDIGKITAPTLVLWGAQDPWIPAADAERFGKDIKGATVKVYPELAHVAHEEDPARTLADLRAFLANVEGAPPAPVAAPSDNSPR